MADVTIHNLDDQVIARLKERAKANNRSLEDELREILTRKAETIIHPAESMTRQERVALAKRIAAMTPDVPQTDSTLLIREDRDR
jgi:plasmid stability protein